jgi:ABC-type phosphate transport system permease subunit
MHNRHRRCCRQELVWAQVLVLVLVMLALVVLVWVLVQSYDARDLVV